MSFWKKLFGMGEAATRRAAQRFWARKARRYVIKAIEMKVGSEYQLAGLIEKEVNGELKSSQFIRADRLASADMASSAAIEKGKQIIKEQGDALFS